MKKTFYHNIIKFIILLPIVVITESIYAQKWVEMMKDPGENFYDVQKEFYKYWNGRTDTKGNGWVQFKRWESFMMPRVYPSGNRLNSAEIWNKYQSYRKLKGSSIAKQSASQYGPDWKIMGPTIWPDITSTAPGLGRINTIAIDPVNSNKLYVGTPAGGLWKSTNSGSTWSPMTDGLASLGISGIAVNPLNPDIIYIATGDGDASNTYSIGVLKSLDGGNTWDTTGLNWITNSSNITFQLLLHPTRPETLWVATSSGLYITKNGGTTWTVTSLNADNIYNIQLDPSNPDIVYACNKYFFKSINGGTSFDTITTGLPNVSSVGRCAIAVTPANSNYVYFLASYPWGSFYGLYQSTTGGNTFSLRTATPNIMGSSSDGSDFGGQGWYDIAITASPSNPNEIYTGGINVWKSTDGGITFNILTDDGYPNSFGYVHADIHTLKFNYDTLYCGSDGGIFKSIDTGSTWINLSGGLQISQFYRLGTAQQDSTIIIGGTQDNGTNLYKKNKWTHVFGGDGMETAVHIIDTAKLYASSQGGAIAKSIDGGSYFTYILIAANTGENAQWTTPFELDPNNPSAVYVGYENIWKTTDEGVNWKKITPFGGNFPIYFFTISGPNSNYIYAGNGYEFFRTFNAGINWDTLSSTLPTLSSITDIAVDNNNPLRIWITVSGYSNGEKVYKSIDGGSSWINVSGSLPNVPVNCIVYEENSLDAVYIGNDIGIFYRDSTLTDWEIFDNGLPNVIVTELEIHYASEKIRAATYGRGIWESKLHSLPNSGTNDASIYSISQPIGTLCDSILTPAIVLKNYGSDTLVSVNINYYVDSSAVQTFSMNGKLPPYKKMSINLPVIGVKNGNHLFTAYSSGPNGQPDGNIKNDKRFSSFVTRWIQANSINESFNTDPFPPVNWAADTLWIRDTITGGFGNSTSSAKVRFFKSFGKSSYLYLPDMNLTNAISPIKMHFSVAYVKTDMFSSDEMSVEVSTDCGQSWTQVWFKAAWGGLPTAPEDTNEFVPTSSQWRKENINLDAYAGASYLEIRFKGTPLGGNNCYIDDININMNPLSLKIFGTNVQCNGVNDGTAVVSVTGGSSPYTFAWSNGLLTSAISNLSAGTYTVTVTDSIGFKAQISTTINPALIITTNITPANATCFSKCDGAADLIVSGGSTPYIFSWSNGESSKNITAICAGSYTVTVRDANNCLTTSSVTITQPDALLKTITQTNITCNGLCDGSISITAVGGTSPYAYKWGTGQTTSTINSLCVGTYDVSITDANNCKINDSVAIIDPTVLSITTFSQDVNCNGLCDGLVTGNVVGGTSPHTYKWSNGSNNDTITGLCAGNYTLTVIDNNGCIKSTSLAVSQPDSLMLFISSTPETSGQNNGTATVSAIGGTAPYSYKWNDSQSQTAAAATGLSAGNYIVTVTDDNSCKENIGVNIDVTGLDWINNNIKTLIYPNPLTNAQNLIITTDPDVINTVRIFNVIGKMLNEYILINEKEIVVPLNHLSQGVYIINIRTNRGLSINQKVIIQ